MSAPCPDAALGPWSTRPAHRAWLAARADTLFDLFGSRTRDPRGGFFELDRTGAPKTGPDLVRPIHLTARMAHCFAIGTLLGRPGAPEMVDHATRFLWERHRDPAHGGYFWSVGETGAADATKQGYGHAFVLLAAASAFCVGHPLARPMLDDVSEILDRRFWEPEHGAIAEEFAADWTPVPGYRGQNSNMHLTEALMAAFEATGETVYLDRAESIAERIIHRAAREAGWRVPEHFSEDWEVDRDYRGNEMFRPSGTTPGHALEWARLILQLWCLGDRRHDWMPPAAAALFERAMTLAWDPAHGGLFYTLDWEDRPAKRMKLWWPHCEGIGAAHFLNAHVPGGWEADYRRLWGVVDRAFLDRAHGGWQEECAEDLTPAFTLFPGKGDIYHALQACLIPLYPATASLSRVIAGDRG
ncbi:AGE family epimerase/isomerase [Amaricoccus solimangrovi]|uniref:AGE family epimerase/isomerase n=1 Tax=Amaricoccus solimangrovi TaxID=2589815 RepID=A0A501WW56_9RHOB|nr:AGE family epimerase/isomerase [Amaricoccus solimangrovi]TPE53509.1 AGE family epimerase/isomerase [Amaricoccus solimangrovi]